MSRRRGTRTVVIGALGVAVALGLAVARARAERKPGVEPGPNPDTAVHRAGAGTPLLLLHGVSATWRAWRDLLPLLEPHHDVIAPTLLGHSGAAALADGVAPSVDALVDGVAAELDRLGIDRVHVVGNSLGGWVALELARRGRARSVVALSPGGAWGSHLRMLAVQSGLLLGVSWVTRHGSRTEGLVRRPRLRRALLSTQMAHPERATDVDALVADIRSIRSAPVVLPLLRVIQENPFRPLADPGCPVRIVWGRQDRLLPFEHFGRPLLDRIPSAELVRLDGAGHVPMWDRPDRVAELILETTAAVDGAGR